MEEAVRFFNTYETWIYLALGAFAVLQIRKFLVAWEELRGAAFGMERENAQSRLNQAATTVVLILMVSVAEFVLVSFVAPTMPGAVPIPTSTLHLLATATTTALPGGAIAQQTPPGTLKPTVEAVSGEGCVPGQVALTSPKDGDEVSGVVTIQGTADFPNFGFYKYEVARPGETIWLSINAGEKAVKEGVLGEWITNVLPPGDYMLRLVVADNQGKFLPACTIRVRVSAAQP